jgi:hypothetical protein
VASDSATQAVLKHMRRPRNPAPKLQVVTAAQFCETVEEFVRQVEIQVPSFELSDRQAMAICSQLIARAAIRLELSFFPHWAGRCRKQRFGLLES